MINCCEVFPRCDIKMLGATKHTAKDPWERTKNHRKSFSLDGQRKNSLASRSENYTGPQTTHNCWTDHNVSQQILIKENNKMTNKLKQSKRKKIKLKTNERKKKRAGRCPGKGNVGNRLQLYPLFFIYFLLY